MKIRIVFYILLFTAVSYSSAQSFKGGVLGGISGTQISGDMLTGFKKAGLYLGAFVNHDISPKSSFQMELAFIQKGSRSNADTSYLLRISYVELLFNYRYKFHPKMKLESGLSYGVLVSEYEEVMGYPYDRQDPEFEPGDFCFHIGFIYALTEKLDVHVRYANSIIKVRSHGSGATYRLNKGQYNEVLSFILYYQLNK